MPRPCIDQHEHRVRSKRQLPPDVRNDDVGALGQIDRTRRGFDEGDAIVAAIRPGERAREADDRIRFDGVDAPRARTTREQREDSGSGADIEDNRALANGLAERVYRPEPVIPAGVVRDERKRRFTTPALRAAC